MPILTANWRWLSIAVAIVAVFFSGMHYQRLNDEAAAAVLYKAQQEANAEAQAELDKKAKQAEQELAAERAKAASLADQWEKERHDKSHTVCPLSAGSIRLLQAASK
jgi:hypothetical protein